MVSAGDYAKVAPYKWRAIKSSGKVSKVAAWMRVGGKLKTVALHRFILGLVEDWPLVDHMNGDPLDNQRENLRICTYSQNACNRRTRADSKTGLKGISPRKNGKFWARVQVNGRRVSLGLFDTAEQAHAAYIAALPGTHGEFSRAG